VKHPKLVSAPAGSGKTTRLVQEYLGLLETFDADRIVAITFTRKAAAELVDRVSSVLRAILGHAEVDDLALYQPYAPTDPELIREALAKLAGAPIGTADAFVQTMLQEQILHAHLPLPDGDKAWLDGIERAGDESEAYELAARELLEKRGPEAERVLAYATVGEGAASVAALAQRPALQRASAVALRNEVAVLLRARIKAKKPEWCDVAPGEINKAGEEWDEAVLAWLAEPAGAAPDGLLPWLTALAKGKCPARRLDALAVLAEAAKRLEIPLTPTLAGRPKFESEWGIEGSLANADALADALATLAAAARTQALKALAAAGAAGYGELLLAATALCRAAPESLRSRYDALLVDEVQDTSAAQLDFYTAFASLRDAGPGAPIQAFFVGDVRQSIYRFRDADPTGWKRLEAHVAKPEDLWANYRSSHALVGAQRLLFQDFPGVHALEGLQAKRGAVGHLAEPVHVVAVEDDADADVDDLTVHHFATRLATLPRRPDGARVPHAAVLVTSWKLAARAKELLRAHGIPAQLTGDKALLSGRVATDVRLFLRALLDATDDLAMVGVLKHPSIGVSDAGLLALRTTEGLYLSAIFNEKTEGDWPASDQRALARGAGPLRAARRALGREPTADVLERLASELHWRPLLQHGPEGERGEAVAQLEVVIELVRQLEEPHGTDPYEVLAKLEPKSERVDDLPPVRLEAGKEVVTITTIFAAKGLEWDHVAILGIAGKGGGTSETEGLAVTFHHPANPFGVRLDPRGALAPLRDPIAALWSAVDADEGRREAARLFYVAFTRAAETVTFGLPKASQKAKGAKGSKRAKTSSEDLVGGEDGARGENEARSFLEVLRDRVSALGKTEQEDLVGVVKVLRSKVDVAVAPPKPSVRARTRLSGALGAKWREARGHTLAQPSALKDSLERPEREAICARLAASASFVESSGRVPQAPSELEEDDERDIGELVHGWLERWAFRGAPELAMATEFLTDRYRLEAADAASIGAWLCEAGRIVRDELPGFAALLANARRVSFEQPLIGVVGETILSGRTDLTIERSDGAIEVIDFKAGKEVAKSATTVPGFSGYALQLHAYAELLRGAGLKVAEVGLLYVRGASWVRFAG
jgi:ATP-dependent helicase/nuclease subunit A